MPMVRNRIPDTLLKEMFPKRLKRISPSKQIYDQLREMILTGELKKGDKLIQEKVARRFRVGRTSVISVFSRLKKEGLITSRQGVGSEVKYKRK